MNGERYTDLICRELTRLKKMADGSISQVSDEQFFTALSADDNSIAIIVKHVAGNMRSRWRDFLTSDGEKPDRNRNSEFLLGPDDVKSSLLEGWEAGWGILFEAIESLGDGDLDRQVTIRGEPLTVLQAINRQLTHYAAHVGQVVLLAKHYAAGDWKTLSIPKGRSESFNEDPENYLGGPKPR